MSRAVCADALAFMVALAEVLAWLCLEVHVPPPQSPSACYTPSLFSAGRRGVPVAGVAGKEALNECTGRSDARGRADSFRCEFGDFTLGFKVAGDVEQHGACLKFS